MGTATYFSPEQAQGAQPDPRSDLYSLGIVMYEMVAGRPPFTGDNPVASPTSRCTTHPQPLNQIVPDVPRPYEAIVAKLLAKDPAVRYPTADALRDDLRRFRNGERPVALESAAATARGDRRGDHRRGQPVAAAHRGAAQGRRRTRSADRTGRNAPGPRWPPGGRRAGALIATTRSSRTGWYALAAFFALISLGIGGFLLFNALSNNDAPGNARALDDYVGQELSVVTDSLNRLQRPYSLQEEDQANDFGPNIVTRTEPKAGVILGDDTVVAVYYNPDATTAVVPDVSGRTLDEARSALRTAGFQVVSATTAPDATVAAGRVIRTDPPAGQDVNVQAEVKIVVSSGTAAASTEGSLTVPYLIQKTEERARSILADAGLDVVVVYYDGPDAVDNDGLVMNVEPRYNSPVSAGDTITITVGRPAAAPPTNPQQTNPPQTNPPQTNPPPTNPPQTNPPQTNPPPTNPPATTPPTTTPAPTTAAATTTTAPHHDAGHTIVGNPDGAGRRQLPDRPPAARPADRPRPRPGEAPRRGGEPPPRRRPARRGDGRRHRVGRPSHRVGRARRAVPDRRVPDRVGDVDEHERQRGDRHAGVASSWVGRCTPTTTSTPRSRRTTPCRRRSAWRCRRAASATTCTRRSSAWPTPSTASPRARSTWSRPAAPTSWTPRR